MDLKQALKEKWYSQTFNTTPFLLSSAADKHYMKKGTGLIFTNYLCIYKEDYGDMSYYAKDLERLGKALVSKLKKDKDYFVKVKRLYDKQILTSKIFFRKVDKTDLSKVSNEELISILNKAKAHTSISVGIAHIIEPFTLTTDVRIKDELSVYAKDSKELNRIFILLTSPIKESFVNRYEKSLSQVAKESNKTKKAKLIEKIIRDFCWIRNSYAGKHILTKQEIEEELKSIKGNPQVDFKKIIKEKKKIIKRLNLPAQLVSEIKATELIGTWQDERKENILTAIDYLDNILMEVSKRVKFDIKYLRYMGYWESTFKNITSKEFQKKLVERRSGCIYIEPPNNPRIYSGKDYIDFVSKKDQKRLIEVKEITGMTASTGTAVGRVKVCTTIESVKKMEEGDILVAPMTRPEYVPAMRKAAAIITDEGGITCHAAIISRELNIPCIIGTKVATKVLKDNDLVEIKGNHGLIIILKKA